MLLECDTGAEWLVWQRRDIIAVSVVEWGSWWHESQAPVPHALLRPLASHCLSLAFDQRFSHLPNVIGLALTVF